MRWTPSTKFQGREQDAIILTSVDNVITDFVDDPHMLNVAVSRAVHSLAVITSQDPRNDQTNYGDLARYIEYNNFEIIQSQIYSVFDMLYQGYAEQRREYLQKHKRVSEYDSENLMHSVIQEILSDEPFSSIGCAVHFSLATLVKDYAPLTEEERKYARNPLTHVDFLLFNQMDKQPVLAIEVDGGSHKSGSKQAERDAKKNSVLKKCAILLHRLRTDGSGENRDCIKEGMIMPRIIRNAIRCKKCGDVIESKTVHDFKFCSCGSCAVDGGHDYLRRCGNREDWEELSEAEKVENNGALT